MFRQVSLTQHWSCEELGSCGLNYTVQAICNSSQPREAAEILEVPS